MQKAILVTGASSGIGNHITRQLAAAGHTVYATARKSGDLKQLAKIKNVIPLSLNVTQAHEIDAAVAFVAQQGTGLYGLVNNAGIGGLGELATWNETELLELFDVNVFGPWRMSSAFMEMLLESQGRIVNIGSQGGTITKKYYGPYSMTKYALEAYTEALREELLPHQVHVSIVQPGGIISRVGENAMPGIVKRLQRSRPPFKEGADQLLALLNTPPDPDLDSAPESESNRKPSSPEIVSKAVEHALFSDNPQERYLVGTTWEGDRVIHALLKKVVQANNSPQHQYSRDTLVDLLDKYLHETQN